MKQRLYLSGPITGVPNYMDIFNRAEAVLVGAGYQVVNPANMCYVLNSEASHEDYMRVDMEMLRMCDVLVQLPGWEKSIGCNREYGMALERDMVILEYTKFTEGVKNA